MSDTVANPPLAIRIFRGSEEIPSDLDPRLQNVLFRRHHGLRVDAAVSVGADEAAVVARVTDPGQWTGMSEVRPGSVIGELADGTWVVTGRIPILRVPHVRQQPFVLSLKGSQLLRPVLHATLSETRGTPDLLPESHRTRGGAGVVIGVVDYGCDFVHQHFRHADGGTRLLCIWNQNGPDHPSSPLGYGRVYTRAEIDRALAAPDPYADLGYGPFDTESGTHGTHVLDIAAGSGTSENAPGLAPEADLIFVDVSHDDIPWEGGDVAQGSLGDSVRLLEAVQFIFQQAGDRPCVINVSLGTNGGPHDGTTLVEQGLDALIRQAPNRAVVIAAGNSFGDQIHVQGRIAEGESHDLVWKIPDGSPRHHEMELWYPGKDRFRVDLLSPSGTVELSLAPGEKAGVQLAYGEATIFATNRLNDPNNRDNVIGIFLRGDVLGGDWTVRLHGESVTNGEFHAWIERDNTIQSRFAAGDGRYTVGSLSCGELTLVTGSYDAHRAPECRIGYYSSAGPTRTGRQKPEVSAPGHNVWAARSGTPSGVVAKRGTSMAAPAVAGIIALMLAEARARGFALNANQIRGIVIASARPGPPDGGGWDDRYGHGRISAQAAVQGVIRLAAAAVGLVPPAALEPVDGPETV